MSILKTNDCLDSLNRPNSVYPPTKYLTNGPWIYMVPQFKPKSVLMLGYARGTVAGLIRLMYGDVPITAVDIVPCKDRYGVNFIQADAKDYIKTCKKHDVVIVDLFSSQNKVDPDFVFSKEFAEDLYKICNYLIINMTNESDMKVYRKIFNRFGSNTVNRLSNRIYYYGTKDYNHLIIR